MMIENPEPTSAAADPPPPASSVHLPRAPRAAALLNTSARLATTALFAATEPKVPRLVGD
jgi:hypothetical protein